MPSLRTLAVKVKPSVRFKLTPAAKTADPFYLSPEWVAFVKALKIERFGSIANARCEDADCRCSHQPGVRLFADHMIELKDGGPRLDKRFIMFRCGSSHSRVTAERRAIRYQR